MPFSAGRAWNCEQCAKNKQLRKQRGNCGGSFLPSLAQSRKDNTGVFMNGYRIAPNSAADYSELKLYSCPVALSNQIAPIVQSYNRIKAGLVTIKDLYPSPTCAIIEAFEIISYNHNEMISRQHEQQMKES